MRTARRFLFAFLFCVLCTAPLAVSAGQGWGLHFATEGGQPVGNKTSDELAHYGAWYVGAEEDKVLYLTFDAGYENGHTPGILDVLAKHEAPAAFFLVGNYIRDEPDLIRRMVAEGHTVGNHTMTHPDMSKISNIDAFRKELALVEEHYRTVTEQEIPRYYRPPKGIYNEANLKMAQELGYTTVFWSLAYNDWDNNNQPSRNQAMNKLIPRVHPGAVILLHNTSKTNALILDELLTKYKEMGYRFEGLGHLMGQ